MAKVVIDTDVLIDYTRGREYAALLLTSFSDDKRCTTVVNHMELLQGARNKLELRKLDRFIQLGFEVLPLTARGCGIALELIRDHALRDGLRVGDALVAAIALEHKASLITGNSRHFEKIAGLQVLDSFPE